jgi:hypothetical protein
LALLHRALIPIKLAPSGFTLHKKICCDLFSVIGGHVTQHILSFAVSGAFQNMTCPLRWMFYFSKNSPFFGFFP